MRHLCSVPSGVKQLCQMSPARSPHAPPAAAGLLKRSIAIAGHKTSMALEPEFWAALEQIAATRGLGLAELIAAIDAERADTADARPLASAVRVFALHHAPRSDS